MPPVACALVAGRWCLAARRITTISRATTVDQQLGNSKTSSILFSFFTLLIAHRMACSHPFDSLWRLFLRLEWLAEGRDRDDGQHGKPRNPRPTLYVKQQRLRRIGLCVQKSSIVTFYSTRAIRRAEVMLRKAYCCCTLTQPRCCTLTQPLNEFETRTHF